MTGWGQFVLHRGTDIVHVIGATIVIGRSQTCDMQVTEEGISRRHCELVASADGVTLRDLDSSHGTFVDGRRLPPGRPVPIRAGTVITLASSSARLLLVDAKFQGKSVLESPERQAQPAPKTQPIAALAGAPTAATAAKQPAASREEASGAGFGFGLFLGVAAGILVGVAVLLLVDVTPLIEALRDRVR